MLTCRTSVRCPVSYTHLEYEERGTYDVSPEQIEIYRAFGDNMTVQELSLIHI